MPPRKLYTFPCFLILIATAIILGVSSLAAQNKPPQQPEQQQQTPPAPQPQKPIPDAPSAVQPPPALPFPDTPTTPQPPPQGQQAPPPAAETPSGTNPGPAPSPRITEAPPGAQNAPGSARDQLFTLTKSVNFVPVPVTVKDQNGVLVDGLLAKDFTVYEDGEPQKLTFFTSDPFPLSAAVVLDLSMSQSDVDKIKNTLPALVGAFGQFDEVAIFTYGNTVQQVQGFSSVNSQRLTASLRHLKRQTGRTGGVPVTSGPLAGSGPIINGRPWDQGARPNPVYHPESHVLNDAVLEAANELAMRPADRRKIIFVISDGREYNSDASYSEVLHVLLARQIAVYAVGTGSAAVPLVNKAERLNLPRTGSGDILPKYVNATGGELIAELNQAAIERAYSRITADARNQYTLGYTTRATPSSAYRTIEVVVNRPNLRVHARAGYYPLPPASR